MNERATFNGKMRVKELEKREAIASVLLAALVVADAAAERMMGNEELTDDAVKLTDALLAKLDETDPTRNPKGSA